MGSGDYGVPDCADELHSALCRMSSTGEPSVVGTKTLVFICHSMGGIVVRYMLEKHWRTFSEKRIGLCLYASPSLGSRWANLTSLVSSLFRNKAASQLQFFSSFLSELDDRFMIYLDGRRDSCFYGAEATEARALISFGGLLNPIVRKYSSARYFSNRRTLPGTDHSSIVKPNTEEDPGHQFLVDFLSNCGFTTTQVASDQECLKKALSPSDVLFSAYEIRLEPFYLQRQMDRDLQQLGAYTNIWLSGPPGVGKTCALKRYAIQTDANSYHICLAQCGPNPSRERLAREIYESLAKSDLKIISDETVFGAIVRLLTGNGDGSICIYIDEVGASNEHGECASTLLALLVDLQAAYQQASQGRLQFVVSSLQRPNISKFLQRGKLLEFFSFLDCEIWSSTSLGDLMAIIDDQLNVEKATGVACSRIVESTNGTPRFLKSLVRKIRFESAETDFDFDAAVRDVSEQIIG